MKVICGECKKVKEITEEESKKIADILLMYNKDFKYDNITRLVSMLEGRTCNDEQEHLYIFHDDFEKIIDTNVKEYKILCDDKLKLDNRENGFLFKLETITEELKNVKNELEYTENQLNEIPEERKNLDIKISNLVNEFEKLTGFTDYSIFSMD